MAETKEAKPESAAQATERRVQEVREVVANQIPVDSSQIAFGFASRDFVQAVAESYKRSIKK